MSGWGRGSTRAWRRVRAFVLERDGYRCQLKLPGCTVHAPQRGGHVHHTRGKRYGDDPAYLVAACPACNLSVGDPTQHDPAPTPRTNWRAVFSMRSWAARDTPLSPPSPRSRTGPDTFPQVRALQWQG